MTYVSLITQIKEDKGQCLSYYEFGMMPYDFHQEI